MESKRGRQAHLVLRCVGAATLALLGFAGCGGGPTIHPVRGKVVFEDGDIKQLAGCNVEFMLESDNTVRADGVIGPDGTFVLQMQHDGKLVKGAVEGTYTARIVLSSDDDSAPKKRKQLPNRRFFDFKTSGLSSKVPTDGEVTLTVSRR